MSARILELAKKKGVQLVMSPDALIADAFSADANTKEAPANDIPDGWEGLDIGSEGKKVFREHILGCKTILWNGPVGVFEIDKFCAPRRWPRPSPEATKNGAYSAHRRRRLGSLRQQVRPWPTRCRTSRRAAARCSSHIEFGDLPGVAAIRD